MDIDRKKLIDRIVKLLALAGSSDFSEESATAKNLAAELLAKHDIAMCELKGCEAFTRESGIGLKFNADHSWHSKGSKGYDVELLRAVAKVNGVAMFTGSWGYHDFAGKPADLEAFKYMREIVIAQREAGLTSYCLETGNRDRSAWLIGFAWRCRGCPKSHERLGHQAKGMGPRSCCAVSASQGLVQANSRFLQRPWARRPAQRGGIFRRQERQTEQGRFEAIGATADREITGPGSCWHDMGATLRPSFPAGGKSQTWDDKWPEFRRLSGPAE